MRWLGGLVAAGSLAAVVPCVAFAQSGAAQSEIARVIANARNELAGLTVPAADSFTSGDREIPAGTSVDGPVAVAGALRVAGTINGDAFTYGADLIVLDGGRVTGSAVALEGRVRTNGGQVDGDARSIGGAGEVVATPAPVRGTGEIVALTLGWAAIALTVGLGLLVFGGPTLNAIGQAVDQQFGRAFLTGLGATLAMAPALALLVAGLVLTILGILLVPFAIVAYVLAVTGLIALGFLAAVRETGQSLGRRNDDLSERGAALRALVIGLAFYFGLWLIAALLTPVPAAATVARVIAVAATWAAATVGLGATILTRAGTRPLREAAVAREVVRAAVPRPGAELPPPPPSQWETPTPVSGVVAARRPTSVKQ